MRTNIKSPVVIREVGDTDFEWFEDIEDVIFDRFDCCWGDNYEGWDSRGIKFELIRKNRAVKWWEKLLNQDISWLEVAHVNNVASSDFRHIILESLQTRGIHQKCDTHTAIADLIERLLQYEFEHTSKSYKKLWRSYRIRLSRIHQ